MDRITKTTLRHMTAQLNKRLGRPEVAWINGNAQVGHLMLEEWSPGDGFTRYKLAEVSGLGGGVCEPLGSLGHTTQEMYAQLRALHGALDSGLLFSRKDNL